MNNINRENYETFFLLYVDNELSLAERKAVDEFVLLNPDLQEELVMLQQSILVPDEIVFNDKKYLLKNGNLPAGIEEKLLSYLDNELSPTERNEMAAMIVRDAEIEKEWKILRQTKVLPETIVFDGKKNLYKKEPGRLIALPAWRFAVAAVFIGFGLWGGLIYFNKSNKVEASDMAGKTGTKKIPGVVKPVPLKSMAPVINTPAEEKEMVANRPITKKLLSPISVQPGEKIALRKLTKSDLATLDVKKKTNNLPTPVFNNLNNIDRNNIITSSVTPQKQLNTIVDPTNNVIANSNGKQDPANSFATNASFTENREENNYDRILFMNEEKIKKSKLGGIFRKVKRVLERSANIKQGDNNNKIKVANLEFAIQ
ncbi:MAG: hypothetical protein ABIS01_11415 [Ferruginibacter sp.]